MTRSRDERSAPQQEQRSRRQQDEDLPRLAEVIGYRVLTGQADNARRDGRDEHEPRDALVRRLHPPSTNRAEPGSDESGDVAPEVGPDSDERPEVERDVEGLVEAVVLLEVRPLGCPRNEDEMADDEIGRSSVRPWTMPSTSAWPFVSAVGSSPTPASVRMTAKPSAAAATLNTTVRRVRILRSGARRLSHHAVCVARSTSS